MSSIERSARRAIEGAALLSLALATVSIGGCFGPVDLSNRQCPCEVGWTCDTAQNRCVQVAVDAARLDGGSSAVDAGSRTDASALDTGVPVDAWTPPDLDAFAVDAFTPPDDAGVAYCPTGARVCDDFEMGAVSRRPPFDWGIDTVRSTARAHRGVASGLFEALAMGDQPSVGIDFATPPSEIWARFWIYVDGSNVINESAIFFAGEGVAPYGSTSLLINDSGLAVYTSGGTGTYLGGVPMPRDRWACIAVHLNIAIAGHIEVSLDGAQAISGDANTTLPAGVNNAGFGITFTGSGQTTPLSFAFDDVALTIDGTPLPCF